MHSPSLATLTEVEAIGLKSDCNMADGHAYHDLSPEQRAIVARLPDLWETASRKKHKRAEMDFRDAFSRLAECPTAASHGHFRICPTASNSIDTAATWLKERRLRTLLVEPTFDNLALILRRRGVSIDSIDEEGILLLPERDDEGGFDALFLVNPNNPTGRTLSEPEFTRIVQWCARRRKVLLLDNTFRFFAPQSYDTYGILAESGVTFVSIEDTGKIWPTQDMKASLLFFSGDIAAEMHLIYEEIYLCVSNFQLEVLARFLEDAADRGLGKAVWAEVRSRRRAFREALGGGALAIDPKSVASSISVEWVGIEDGAMNDFELIASLRERGLVALPGRHFYWNSHGPLVPLDKVRFSLLKDRRQFDKSVEVLKGFSRAWDAGRSMEGR